jgi:hypothetical protein
MRKRIVIRKVTKVASVSQDGTITREVGYRPSAHSRRAYLIKELGIDADKYKLQCLTRLYDKATALGITL